MTIGLIKKYLLPREIDFNAALRKQAEASRKSVETMAAYCLEGDRAALDAMLEREHHSRKLKNANMRRLLDVFITPYDKESIYRMIVQLDWIALSVSHLAIELSALRLECPASHGKIFRILQEMSKSLCLAFDDLKSRDLARILKRAEGIHDDYDEAARQCALAAARHLENDDIRTYLAYREFLNQLKDVAKRIHLAANSLEDMAMKIV